MKDTGEPYKIPYAEPTDTADGAAITQAMATRLRDLFTMTTSVVLGKADKSEVQPLKDKVTKMQNAIWQGRISIVLSAPPTVNTVKVYAASHPIVSPGVAMVTYQCTFPPAEATNVVPPRVWIHSTTPSTTAAAANGLVRVGCWFPSNTNLAAGANFYLNILVMSNSATEYPLHVTG